MHEIHHRLLIASPVEQVFDAITTARGLSAWWTPDATADPQPGSTAVFPFGPSYRKEMRITALKTNEAVSWHCTRASEEWMDTRIHFVLMAGSASEFSEADPEMGGQIEQGNAFTAGTILWFRHEGWRQATPMFAECSYTWARFLRSLKLYCETGTGTPWPEQHRI